MPVLTREQYASKRNESTARPFPIIPSKAAGEATPPPSPMLYVLGYPEPPLTGAANFEFTHTVGKDNYVVRCVNGVVRTKEKAVRDYLVKSGYLELETKEIDNENQN